MTVKFVLMMLLSLLPGQARADILHIIDRGIVDPKTSGPADADPYHHVTSVHSAIPGSGWDFGFSFRRSSATFQWVVDVSVEIDAGKAGHRHDDPPPKLFYYPNWPDKGTVARFDGVTLRSPQFDQGQRFWVHMAPVSYAAKLKVVGAFTVYAYGTERKPTLTHFLDVGTPGLDPLPANDRLYKLTGATAAHPENHYASSATLAALTDLAGAWKRGHPSAPLLEIGNISLPWGGAFDVKGDWKADNMHHAYGIAADIGKTNFTSGERASLIKLMCGSGFYVYSRPGNCAGHYHAVHREEFLTLKRLNWPVRLPAKAERAVNCCAAKAGSAAWRKCIGLP